MPSFSKGLKVVRGKSSTRIGRTRSCGKFGSAQGTWRKPMAGRKPKPVVEQRRAQLDVITEAAYLLLQSASAADDFVNDVLAAYQRLREFPGIGRLYDSPTLRHFDVRIWPLRRFRKFLVFYRDLENHILILRIIHGARSIGEQDLKDLLD